MLTGDHLAIAKEMARSLEMGTDILNAETLPMYDTSKVSPLKPFYTIIIA